MSGTFQIELEVNKLIRFGLDRDSIMRSLESEVEDKVLLEETVDRACESYPDYDLIQFFMKSRVIVDKDGEDNQLYLFNPLKKKVITIDRNRLLSIINPKLDWNSKRYTCNFTYDPFTPYKLKKISGEWRYNLYEAPLWSSEYFESGGKTPLPTRSKIPSIYDKFLKHLVHGDKDSYDYVINWMANMLQKRNYCILTTIGNQGIGKGVLGEIMSGLVGESNYTKTDKKLVTKDFNGQIKNKRLIYLDEVKITNTDQENRLKNLVNDHLEVEQKGKDAILDRNYSSLYFSSNNLDSIKIPSDDRRFSIIMLTDVKLISVMKKNEITDLLKPENISELAYYLMSVKIDSKKMSEVFRSSRAELIRSAGLNAWQEWFIEEWAPDMSGKTLPIRRVTEDVEDEFGSKCRPSRKALMLLKEIYPEVFGVKKIRDRNNSSKQVWVVEIY